MKPVVDFFMNCWDRDYRDVLGTLMVRERAATFQHAFRQLVVSVNNVVDVQDARRLAATATAEGRVDRVVFVQDRIDDALRVCGLTHRELGRVKHFTNYFLVIVTSTDADYVVQCAPDIHLERPFDWVTEAVDKMQHRESILCANPCWGWDRGGAKRDATAEDGVHWIVPGFTDACVLLRRRPLAAPVYMMKHESDQLYPLHSVGAVFEQRVNAFMRHTGLCRLVDSRIAYTHSGKLGSAYPKASFVNRCLRRVRRMLRK